MRELNTLEAHHISAGLDLAFVGGIIAGATGGSLGKTVLYSAAWGAFAGFYAGGEKFGPLGVIFFTPLVAVYEVATGIMGYAIGNLFYVDE